VTAILSTTELTVIPGEETTCSIQVRNTGSVVDEFSFEVLGSAAAWSSVEPARLTLYPGTEESVTVRFAPPRFGEAPSAGPVPFAVRVSSREDPGSTRVEEGIITVLPFMDAVAELVPRTAHGRRSAKFELAFDNRGNTRINAPLAAIDPDNVLRFRVNPPTLVAEPWSASFATVTVMPRKKFWKGPAQTKNFQIVAEPEAMPAVAADGTLLQEALLPPWAIKAALALLALLALLLVLWFTVLKPQIKSTAKKAAQQQVASPQTQAAIKTSAAQAAKQASGGGGAPTPGAPPVAPANPAAPAAAPAAVATSAPIDNRLTTTGSGTASYTVPAGKVLQVTDIVLENMANDDKGTLSIQRNGATLLSVALENFRDLDYHFVSPIIFTAGQKLQLLTNVTTCNGTCQPAIYYSGYLVTPAA
jgi:hypothetical protein